MKPCLIRQVDRVESQAGFALLLSEVCLTGKSITNELLLEVKHA